MRSSRVIHYHKRIEKWRKKEKREKRESWESREREGDEGKDQIKNKS
jgi:hypothetical protein